MSKPREKSQSTYLGDYYLIVLVTVLFYFRWKKIMRFYRLSGTFDPFKFQFNFRISDH